MVNNENFQRFVILFVLIAIWEGYARWLDNSLLFPTFTLTIQTFVHDICNRAC